MVTLEKFFLVLLVYFYIFMESNTEKGIKLGLFGVLKLVTLIFLMQFLPN